MTTSDNQLSCPSFAKMDCKTIRESKFSKVDWSVLGLGIVFLAAGLLIAYFGYLSGAREFECMENLPRKWRYLPRHPLSLAHWAETPF
jgi:hypothetical protein